VNDLSGPSLPSRAFGATVALAVVVGAGWVLSLSTHTFRHAPDRSLLVTILGPISRSVPVVEAPPSLLGAAGRSLTKHMSAITAAPAIVPARVDSISDIPSIVASETSSPNIAPLDLSARVLRAAAGMGDAGNTVRSIGPRGSYQGAEERLAKQMAAAKIPDCMSQDAFKFDPPHLGPATVVAVSGARGDAIDARILFLAHAALAGHCK
jgi:hypothetical protein